jgi:quinol monooxygenase YgiN
VIATVYSFDKPVDTTFVELFERDVRPSVERAGARVLAYFVTDASPNNYPALPVREGENVFVWFTSFPDEDSYAAFAATRDWKLATEAVSGWLKNTPEILRLRPTPRSLLGQ